MAERLFSKGEPPAAHAIISKIQQETPVDLNDLFLTTLKDIYFAERQILKALPKMMKAAQEPKLKEGFATHRDETESQVERLQQVFESINKRAQGKTCEAIKGIIEECDELLEEATEPSAARDAGLIACGQAVEHYEMARYGALIAWANALGHREAIALLQANLDQEKAADALLTKVAGPVNEAAAAG